ncbi:MAG: oligoribonuclease [Pseudohongiellaceae bacterium]
MDKTQTLVWLDLEMTGLNTETDRIIEIATLITDTGLDILAEGPVLAIHQTDDVLEGMDEWNQSHHGASGLIDRVRSSTINEAEAQRRTLEFLEQYAEKSASPLCGNSICQDRRFMAKHMPELEAFFHYRNLDVSTIKELARRWRPDVLSGVTKQSTHQAMEDIKDSVNELRHYRETFFVS